MSVTFPQGGIMLEPVSTALTTTGQTDVYTAQAEFFQQIAEIWIPNTDTSNTVKVTLVWNDASTDYEFWVGNIPPETTAFLRPPLKLTSEGTTHKIKATADTANAVTITVFATEELSQQGGTP